MWESGWFHDRSKEAKLFFIYLITNHRINLCGAYRLPEHVILTETGLKKSEIEKAKKEVCQPNEKYPMGRITFFDEWVYVRNAQKYGGYSGTTNEKAISRELSELPIEIRNCFIEGKCDTPPIPYTYPPYTSINHKSEIINKKSEEGSAEGSIKYLTNLPEEFVEELLEKFDIFRPKIFSEAEKAFDWLEANGRAKKNYKAYFRNWIRN